jgi:hypothetical protein
MVAAYPKLRRIAYGPGKPGFLEGSVSPVDQPVEKGAFGVIVM